MLRLVLQEKIGRDDGVTEIKMMTSEKQYRQKYAYTAQNNQ